MGQFIPSGYLALQRGRTMAAVGYCLLAALAGCIACGSDDPESNESTGGRPSSSGSGGSATAGGSNLPTGGTTTGANSGGNSATGGSLASGGSNSAGGSAPGGSKSTGGSAGAVSGMQPLGAICANDGNCAQSQGAAVCCRSTCTLADQCPTSTMYLPCDSAAACSVYGGGKLCCEVQAGGQTMRFCTKQSACSGKVLP